MACHCVVTHIKCQLCTYRMPWIVANSINWGRINLIGQLGMRSVNQPSTFDCLSFKEPAYSKPFYGFVTGSLRYLTCHIENQFQPIAKDNKNWKVTFTFCFHLQCVALVHTTGFRTYSFSSISFLLLAPIFIFLLLVCIFGRQRLDSVWLCCVAMVYTMCRDHCLCSEPEDTRVMYNETPTVRTTVTLRKSKHCCCKNNNNMSVHFKEENTAKTLWV